MIKRVLMSVLIFTFVVVFFYISAAFVNYNMNAGNWDIGVRVFTVIFGNTFGIISVIFYNALLYDKKEEKV